MFVLFTSLICGVCMDEHTGGSVTFGRRMSTIGQSGQCAPPARPGPARLSFGRRPLPLAWDGMCRGVCLAGLSWRADG